jgi:hypothetical protein
LDLVTGRSNGGFLQYYRYDEDEGAVTCVSCPATRAPTADVSDRMGIGITLGAERLLDSARTLSDDGSRLFFGTADALVPEDTNGGVDIYEWHDGRVGLITDGISDPGQGSHLLYDVSADGRDLIFSAFAALTPDAVDNSMHLYDARIGGGFAFPASRSCEGRACQGEPLSEPSLGDVGSAFFGEGGGTAGLGPVLRVLDARAHGRRVVLRLRVGRAGRVRVTGGRTRTVRRTVAKAGVVVVRAPLTAGAVRALRRAGRLGVRVRVRFAPRGGLSASVRARVLVRG